MSTQWGSPPPQKLTKCGCGVELDRGQHNAFEHACIYHNATSCDWCNAVRALEWHANGGAE